MFCRHMPIACLKCMQKFKPKTLICARVTKTNVKVSPMHSKVVGTAVCESMQRACKQWLVMAFFSSIRREVHILELELVNFAEAQ